MSNVLFFILALLVAAGAIALVVWHEIHSHRQRSALRQLFAETPKRTAATLQEGPCVVEGRAQAHQLIASPISGKQVIAYRVVIEVLEVRPTANGRQSGSWIPVHDGAVIADFEVQDASGRILVRASGARVILNREQRKQSGLFREVPPKLRYLVEASPGLLDLSLSGGPRRTEVRWSEYFLEDGEDVCVYGQVRREIDPSQPAGGYRQPPTKLVLDHPSTEPLIVVDMRLADLLQEL